jgi:hypothetical protein
MLLLYTDELSLFKAWPGRRRAVGRSPATKIMFWTLARVSYRAVKIVSCNNKKKFMVYDGNYFNCSTLVQQQCGL